MFKPKQSALDEVLDSLPIEVRKIVIKNMLPYDTALAWLQDSGIKFSVADVTAMAISLTNRFPH